MQNTFFQKNLWIKQQIPKSSHIAKHRTKIVTTKNYKNKKLKNSIIYHSSSSSTSSSLSSSQSSSRLTCYTSNVSSFTNLKESNKHYVKKTTINLIHAWQHQEHPVCASNEHLANKFDHSFCTAKNHHNT